MTATAMRYQRERGLVAVLAETEGRTASSLALHRHSRRTYPEYQICGKLVEGPGHAGVV